MILHPLKYDKNGKQLCEYCSSEIHYTQKYCSGCKQYIKRGNVTVKRQRKELRIKHLLSKSNIEFIHDKIADNKCTRRRPDFVIHTYFGILILEVDEHQHNRKNYPCECELSRMKEIYMSVGVERLLFVRYNPDKYKSTVPLYKGSERETYLIKYIQEWLDPENKFKDPSKFNLGSVYLFYDGFIPSSVEIETFDPYQS